MKALRAASVSLLALGLASGVLAAQPGSGKKAPASLDDLFELEKAPPNPPAKDKAVPAPASKDALFELDAPAPVTPPQKPAQTEPSEPALPATKADLFGPADADKAPAVATPAVATPAVATPADATPAAVAPAAQAHRAPAAEPGPAPAPSVAQAPSALRGFLQTEFARTYADPEHGSKALARLELGSQGSLGGGVSWKISGRVDFNAIYDLNDHYQPAVRDDQRWDFQLRETYLDVTGWGLDWRLGRQHVVWGEMVGLFFADVVSAKDLREFVLPDFEILRIPQWAARAEYFQDDFHAEAVWIPFPSYDETGTPRNFLAPGFGSDFFAYPLPIAAAVQKDDRPATSLDHGNVGLRLSTLRDGWDLAGFFYTSMNAAPTYYQFTPGVLTPRHDRIRQYGGTLAKDFSGVVLKAEAVFTDGRRYNLTNVTLPDPAGGVVKQDNLDWAVGLDFNPTADTRINTQFYQRYFFDHAANIIPDRAESGVSLLVHHQFNSAWEGEVLLVHSLNRQDWMLRPKATWKFQPDWRLNLGVDVFYGPITGLFGQFDAQDRVYAEIRHDF